MCSAIESAVHSRHLHSFELIELKILYVVYLFILLCSAPVEFMDLVSYLKLRIIYT